MGRILVVAAVLAGGCRFGAYGGAFRGRATTAGNDASIRSDTWELTSDTVVGRFSILSSVGLGNLSMRQRMASGMLETGKDGLDAWVMAGAGVDLIRRDGFHLMAYGAYSHQLLPLDDVSLVSTRLIAGVEAGAATTKRLGLVVRAGFAKASGKYVGNYDASGFEADPVDISGTLFLFQAGFALDFSDLLKGDD